MMLRPNTCINHNEIKFCGCGKNVMCHRCGHGQASHPCECSEQLKADVRYIPEEEHDRLLEEGLHEYAHIWEELARR